MSNAQLVRSFGPDVSRSVGKVVGLSDVATSPEGVAYQLIGGVRRCWTALKGPGLVSLLVGASLTEAPCGIAGSDQSRGRIAVGRSPYAMAFNPNNSKLYVANADDGTVTVIDVSNADPTQCAVLATVSVGTFPTCLTFDSVTNMVACVNGNSGSVSLIDGSTNALIATVAVGTLPYGAAFDTATGRLFVTNGGGATHVSIISESSHTVTDTMQLARSPSGPIVIDAVGRQVIAVTTDAVTFNAVVGFYNADTKAQISLLDIGAVTITGTNRGGNMRFDSVARRAWLTVRAPATYARVFDAAARSEVGSILLPGQCHAIAFDQANSLAYAAIDTLDSVAGISMSNLTVLTTVKAHYSKSIWYELTPSLPESADGFLLSLECGTGGNRQCALVDIGIGADGQEKVLAANLICCSYNEYIPAMWRIRLPLKAGSRIVVRGQGTIASDPPWVALYPFSYGFGGEEPFGRIVTYGADAVNTRGTPVDPGPSAGNFGNWADFGVTQQNIRELIVAFAAPCQSAAELVTNPLVPTIYSPTVGEWTFQVGIGDGTPGGTVPIVPAAYAAIDGAYSVSGPLPALYQLPVGVKAGSRLWVRARSTTATVGPDPERKVDVVLYGLD